MSQATFYPDAIPSTSCDGDVARDGVNQTLANIVAGAGTAHNTSPDIGNGGVIEASATLDQYDWIARGIILFDTSSLPDTATVSAAQLSLFIQQNTDQLLVSTFNIVGSTPASNTVLANSDYGNLGTTKYSADMNLGDVVSDQYFDIALNATGIAAVSTTGITKFGIRLTADGLGGGITWAATFASYVNFRGASHTGTSQDPTLLVTYSTVTNNANFLNVF